MSSYYYGDGEDRQNIVRSCVSQEVFYSSADTDIQFHTLENPLSSDKFCIMFGFKCEFIVDEWYWNDGSRQEVYRNTFNRALSLSETVYSCFEDTQRYLHYNFLSWPLSQENRTELVNFVLEKALEGVQSMPESCNTIQINSTFTIIHCYLVEDLSSETDLAITESMEEAEPDMVPASESAIDSLKRVLMGEGSNVLCTVCMEMMEGGCEAKELPCSHVFHEDCIEAWLRTSHYCPVCRFELPTTTAATPTATASLED